MADVSNRSDCIIKNLRSKMKCVQEKEPIMDLRGDRKIRPSNHSLAALGKPRDARH